jgi:dipeptidyl aminopeptidase/acylaminoacyl peptidase
MKKLVLLACALSLASLAADARAAGRPISHEAMWLMKRVSAPVPSPDGRLVVFSVTEPAYDDREQVSDLWLVETSGSGAPRRLTSTKGAESGAAWSPDGRRLAFSARREGDEASQLYVLDLAGGEAQRVTSLSTGARLPRWRPDGGALLFSSSVHPGASDDDANKKIAAERRGLKYRLRAYDGFPIRNWDRWLDDMQTHVFVQTLEPGAKARDLLAGSDLVKATGFGGRRTNAADELDAVWTPDGSAVVFVASTDRDSAAYADPSLHLYVVPAAGGEPRRLTRANGEYTAPSFAPDGKALFARFTPNTARTYALTRIARLAWPADGEPALLTAAFDRSVSAFSVSADARTLFFTAEDAGLEKVYAIAASGGAAQAVLESQQGVWGAVAAPARGGAALLVGTWESAVRPAEVFALDATTKTARALTRLNDAKLAELDWPALRHFTFTSKAGKTIHNLIALPPAFDETKKYPLLVLMHGGPHSMWRDQISLRWNYHLLAQPGYVVLATNYTGSTGFGERFAQEIQLDPFKTPADEINQAADEAAKRFAFVDATRQCAAGASYGGHLANWLQATTTRYRCLISHAGLINAESQWGTSDVIYGRELMNGGLPWEGSRTWREQNPIRHAKAFKTPILLSVGENDFRVPLNQTLENWSVLKRLRVPSRLLVWPDENHWILKAENSRKFYEEVHAWLARYLSEPALPAASGGAR